MNDNIVRRAENAKDLGVVVDNKLNLHDNIKATVGKAKRRAFCMSIALVSKDIKTWMKLYKTYIRRIIEYGITAYCPYQKGQLATLESVQRWATIQIPGLGKYPYDTRKNLCNAISAKMQFRFLLKKFWLRYRNSTLVLVPDTEFRSHTNCVRWVMEFLKSGPSKIISTSYILS